MKPFREWLVEDFWDNKQRSDKNVYRADKSHITDFKKKMASYDHNKDWTESGRASGAKPGAGWKRSKGLFAGGHAMASTYTGPRSTKFVTSGRTSGQKPTLFVHTKDVNKLRHSASHISGFDKSKFKTLGSGEQLSTNPGKPTQQKIVNAYSEMKKRYNVKTSKDLTSTYMKQRTLTGVHGTEGLTKPPMSKRPKPQDNP